MPGYCASKELLVNESRERYCETVSLPVGFKEEEIPLDAEGNPLWTKTGEYVIPEFSKTAREMLRAIYACSACDTNGQCLLSEEQRPEMCRLVRQCRK